MQMLSSHSEREDLLESNFNTNPRFRVTSAFFTPSHSQVVTRDESSDAIDLVNLFTSFPS